MLIHTHDGPFGAMTAMYQQDHSVGRFIFIINGLH
jgi:hypothetical protein